VCFFSNFPVNDHGGRVAPWEEENGFYGVLVSCKFLMIHWMTPHILHVIEQLSHFYDKDYELMTQTIHRKHIWLEYSLCNFQLFMKRLLEGICCVLPHLDAILLLYYKRWFHINNATLELAHSLTKSLLHVAAITCMTEHNLVKWWLSCFTWKPAWRTWYVQMEMLCLMLRHVTIEVFV
jgi:hypothetical protein